LASCGGGLYRVALVSSTSVKKRNSYLFHYLH
jgi:hypothetical protein